GRSEIQRKRRLLQQQRDRAANQAALRWRQRLAALAADGRTRLGCRLARADAGELGQALLHQVAEGTVRDLRQQRFDAFGQPRLAVERGQRHALRQRVEEDLRQRRACAQPGVEALRAFLAYDAVGVFA